MEGRKNISITLYIITRHHSKHFAHISTFDPVSNVYGVYSHYLPVRVGELEKLALKVVNLPSPSMTEKQS